MESKDDQEATRKLQKALYMCPNSYKLLHQIGSSSDTIVYQAIYKPTQTMVVIKSINLQPSRTSIFGSISREAYGSNLVKVKPHPNLLCPDCCFPGDDNRLWIRMPFMSAGSLQSIIASSSDQNRLPEAFITIILKQTLKALAHLHSSGRIHRDIKPSNILIDHDGLVKLADYAVSASVYGTRTLPSGNLSSSMETDVSGSPYWIAPEVLSNVKEYDVESDIWAFGITALELAHGRPPISFLPPSASFLLKVTQRFLLLNNLEKMEVSMNFKNMVSLCLEQDPLKRPSARSLLNHSVFTHCDLSIDFLVKYYLPSLTLLEKRFKQNMIRRFPPIPFSDHEKVARMVEPKVWIFDKAAFQLDPMVESTEAANVNEAADEIIERLTTLSRSLREQSRQVINAIRLFS